MVVKSRVGGDDADATPKGTSFRLAVVLVRLVPLEKKQDDGDDIVAVTKTEAGRPVHKGAASKACKASRRRCCCCCVIVIFIIIIVMR